jgi:ribosome-associated toxin RatA of RatAB toxin-antitoxin module
MIIILYIILGLIATILFIALVLPKNYKVTKSIVINSDLSKCYDMVADLNNYRDWNPWSKMEPDAKKTITGTPKTIGHQYDWEGKKIGIGRLTVKKVDTNKSVDLDLEFFKPFQSKADDNWVFEQMPNNQVKVIWSNRGELPLLAARLMGPMITKNLNQQFEQGLASIKELCEK